MHQNKHLVSTKIRVFLLFTILCLIVLVALLTSNRLQNTQDTAPSESSAAFSRAGSYVLNLNSTKENSQNIVRYEQPVTLNIGEFRLKVMAKKNYPGLQNAKVLVACNQPSCTVNGTIVNINQTVPGAEVNLNALPDSGIFENKYADFNLGIQPDSQNFVVRIIAEQAAEIDLKEVSLRGVKGSNLSNEILRNHNFENRISPVSTRIMMQPDNWGAGTDNFGFYYSRVQADYPYSQDGKAFVVNTSARFRQDNSQENSSIPVIRYEQTTNLPSGNYYLFVRAKANLLLGRGAKIILACGRPENCGPIQFNQELASIDIPQNDVLQNLTANFTIPGNAANAPYYIRIYVNDGSEAAFDAVKILRQGTTNNAEGLNLNSNFEQHNTAFTIAKDQPTDWTAGGGNWGYEYGRVVEIKYDLGGKVYCTDESGEQVALQNMSVRRMKSRQVYVTVGMTDVNGRWGAIMTNSTLSEQPPFTLEVFNNQGEQIISNNSTCDDASVNRGTLMNQTMLREQSGCRRSIYHDQININLGSCIGLNI